jgi:DNA polymerase/3'-5' exonuclease PolX
VEDGEMSEGKRIPRPEALAAAQKICTILSPVCERIEIAGSLRRLKPDVGDIEIVCIPKIEYDLLGNEYYKPFQIERILGRDGFEMPRFNGEHFKQFDTGPCNCDLFITTPEQWGVIFTIRTGPADFSHRLVTQRNKGGLLPSYLRVKDGRIWHGDQALGTPEEKDVFALLRLPWIEPCDRK